MSARHAFRILCSCMVALLGYATVEATPTTAAPKRTRGSNTQVVLPNNLYLADVDGDRKADFLQVAGPRLLVSKTNFKRTGVLHAYFERDILRVITGDFKGIGRDYVCLALDDNSLRCHKGSDDGGAALWRTWSQPNFIVSTEEVIVADYDGNGNDDLLLYDRNTGAIRFYAIGSHAYFEPMTDIALGDLVSMQHPGLQLRAGDHNGDARADLLAYDPSGRVSRYTSADQSGTTTFWLGFITDEGWIRPHHDVSIARLDNDRFDDVVVRNRNTGAIGFYQMEYESGALRRLTSVSPGQLPVQPGGVLAWTWNKTPSFEPGADTRDDALYLGNGQRINTPARWDGTQYTYWWSYSRGLPLDHSGWPVTDEGRWLVLKCKVSDGEVPDEDDDAYWAWLFRDRRANDNMVAYWRDISYGARDMSGNVVDQTWHTMDVDTAGAEAAEREQMRSACLAAAGNPSLAGYLGAILVYSGYNPAYGRPGWVALGYARTLMTMSHEVAHGEGFNHSWDDTSDGEYGDTWDIMSAASASCFSAATPFSAGTLVTCAGPGMNGPHVAKKGWIPAHRVLSLTPTAAEQSTLVTIAPLNRPEANGHLLVKIGSNPNDYYTVELRHRREWDRYIGGADGEDAVLVHRVQAGMSILQTGGVGAANAPRLVDEAPFTVGGPVSPGGVLGMMVSVVAFNTAESTATVRIAYNLQ